MKIVCDACSAKYSIADEKVQGKVFKIRCKKCSNIIVVRGTGGAEEAAPAAAAAPAPGTFDQKETRVYDYGGYDGAAPPGDDAVWHIVVDQEQVGPLSVADVQARFAAGEIDGESYIWREGFADWQPLSQVPDFANLVASGSTTTAQPSSGQDAVASMFGATGNYDDPASGRGDPNDVFAAHAAQQDDGGAADLFGQKAAAPRSARRTDAPAPAGDADEPLFGSGEVPRGAEPATISSMKGQRNENSVLFSLGNLAALASDQPRAPAASAPGAAPGTAGHGGGEGSGLIDIRSMASAYLGGGAKPGMSPSGPKIGSADDLPVFSTAAFSEPAVIMPTLGGARNNNKLMYALLGAVALLAVVAVVLVVVVMGKKDSGKTEPGNTAAATVTDPAKPGPDKPGLEPGGTEPGMSAGASQDDPSKAGDPPGVPGTDEPAVPPVASPPPEAAKPVDPPPSSKPSSSSSKPSSKPDSKPSSSSKPDSKPSSSSKPDSKPAASSGGSCLDEVGCMLAAKRPACCDRYGSGAKKPTTTTTTSSSGGGDVPDSLTKAHISAGVAKIQSKASACGAKSSAKGSVKVSVKVTAGGSVSGVTVKESPDKALGACVAAAMQKATFAKTKSGGSFSYPFRF